MRVVHRAYLTFDRGFWTIWAADVGGSAQGIPLGYITEDYESWDPAHPERLIRKGFKCSLMGENWRNPRTFPLFRDAQFYILQNHPYKEIETEFAHSKETK